MKGLPELVIGDLKVKRPVIQGGMGVGVSLGSLPERLQKKVESGSSQPHRSDFVNRILKRIQGRQISVQLDLNFKEQERRLRMA